MSPVLAAIGNATSNLTGPNENASAGFRGFCSQKGEKVKEK